MNFTQVRIRNVRVYLGGANIGVTEQGLHRTQVSTITQKVVVNTRWTARGESLSSLAVCAFFPY